MMYPFYALFVLPVFPLLYFIPSTSVAGRTGGKAKAGIKVVNSNGRPPGFGRIMLRESIGKLIPFYSLLALFWVTGDIRLPLGIFAVLLLLGFFRVFGSSKNQGWHDKIAGTYVIKAPLQDDIAEEESVTIEAEVAEEESEPVTMKDDETPKAEPARRFRSNRELAQWTTGKMSLGSCKGHPEHTGSCFVRWDLYRLYESEFGIELEEAEELYSGLLAKRILEEHYASTVLGWLVWIVLLLLHPTDPQERDYCCTTFS